jgi:hypothetical protein
MGVIADMTYVAETTVGAPGGVATLDATGLVPVTQLPISTTPLTFTGSGAPSSSLGQNGDTYIEYSNGNVYIKSAGTWGSPVARFLSGSVQAAPAGFNPANPTGTSSTSLVMMGLGGKCSYTPTGSGHVLVNVTGGFSTQISAANVSLGGRYGTGTGPAHGAAATGIRYGGSTDQLFRQPALSGSAVVPFALTALLSLTENSTYWFDLVLCTSNSSDIASVQNISITLAELPS